MSTYSIADFFTRIKNAQTRDAQHVLVPKTNVNQKISTILSNEGFLDAVEQNFNGNENLRQGKDIYLRLTLPFQKSGKPFSIKIVSTPGCRIYVSAKNIPFPRRGMSLCLLSTSKGIMTNHEAKTLGIGGELLCILW
jgi:small subunit ribosomal protein S8